MNVEDRFIRRSDGGVLRGSLTFKACVAQRDWEAVRALAPQQRTAHGEPLLKQEDWAFLREMAARDGVAL